MYLIVIAWLYVTLLMGLDEEFSTQGTVLGAIITFLLYGVLPISLVVYLMGTPLRRKARKQMEERECAQLETEPPQSTGEPDAGRHAPSVSEDKAVTPVRKEH